MLHDVTFHADYGSVLAILGPNGAGKSTLLRALAGLLAYEGAIALDGAELSGLSRREIGRRIAFVPQRTQLTSRLPVWTVVSHGRYAHRGGLAQLSARDERAIESAMLRADVAHLAAREFPQLSAGEQRRVLLARALATEARVLLLDEPTASLDIPHALSLFETLRGLAESGHCVVIVLHQLDDALRFTDRALLLQRRTPARVRSQRRRDHAPRTCAARTASSWSSTAASPSASAEAAHEPHRHVQRGGAADRDRRLSARRGQDRSRRRRARRADRAEPCSRSRRSTSAAASAACATHPARSRRSKRYARIASASLVADEVLWELIEPERLVGVTQQSKPVAHFGHRHAAARAASIRLPTSS